ncbi:hypothetical protein D3C72_669860 [compost metagenome]
MKHTAMVLGGWSLLILAGCAAAPSSAIDSPPVEVVAPLDGVDATALTPSEAVTLWPRPPRAQQLENLQKAGVPFMDGGHSTSQLHIHVYVSIRHNGRPVTMPANVGIVDGRMAVLHTHDVDGTIHIEGPVGRTYTLGQFFAVWGVSLEGAKVYHQGQPLADPASYTLVDRQSLRIEFTTGNSGT